jgi:hypothetical protein
MFWVAIVRVLLDLKQACHSSILCVGTALVHKRAETIANLQTCCYRPAGEVSGSISLRYSILCATLRPKRA